MKSGLILFIFGFIVWMLLSWPLSGWEAVEGCIVTLFVVLLTGGFFVKRPHLFREAGRYVYFLWYVPVFAWECFKANLDVAYRVSHPGMPIKPGIVKVKTKLKTETGITFLANSITLTPGTLSVDVDRENGFLYVHWINVTAVDVEGATDRIVRRFENVLGKIFE
jgi:multicomponent Na+:H+ antiporter subunit E